MDRLRKEGWTCVRTAGSHGFCDIIAFKSLFNEIKLIQCKYGKSYSQNMKNRILEENKAYNGVFNVTFEVIDA